MGKYNQAVFCRVTAEQKVLLLKMSVLTNKSQGQLFREWIRRAAKEVGLIQDD